MFKHERLRALAEIKRASGSEIPRQAAEMNMSASALRGFISGNKLPNLVMLRELCDYYQVNPDWLLGYDNSSLHVTLEVG